MAGASSADAVSPDTTTSKTIRLVAHQDAFKVIDVGRRGFSPGDYFVFEETLRNRDPGQVVGHDSVQCTVNFTTFMCAGTLSLNGKGNVEISGAISEHGKQLIAVTGGTELLPERPRPAAGRRWVWEHHQPDVAASSVTPRPLQDR